MPKIKLKIGDRPYEISCNNGDEERITKLAAVLDGRVSGVAKSLGQASENMILVVTCLMMEDEISKLSQGVPVAAVSRQSDSEVKERINRAIAEALEPFTKKLEALANSIEVG